MQREAADEDQHLIGYYKRAAEIALEEAKDKSAQVEELIKSRAAQSTRQ